MSNTSTSQRLARRLSIPAVTLSLLAATALVPAAAAAHDGHTARTHAHPAPAHALTARQLAFHDAMRKLWEDHITWTRLAIVSFAGGLPDLPATEARLLRQSGGHRQGDRALLRRDRRPPADRAAGEHILGAVALLQAAKSGDQTAIGNASRPGTPTPTRSPTSCTPPTPTSGRGRRWER